MAIRIADDTTWKWICVVLAGLSACFVFGVLAWAVNKGFELSDESYYCLSTENPHSNSLLNSYFGLITHRLCLGVSDLRGLRICHLVYHLAATLFFAVSFLRFFSRWYTFSLSSRVIVVLVLFMASALHYDHLPLAMSYNSWSLILSLVFFSLGLQSYGRGTATRALLFLLMGSCAALLFYNKLPNALVVAGVFTLWIFLFRRSDLWSWLLMATAGAAAGALFLFLSPEVATEKTIALVRNLRAISGSTLGAYSRDFAEFISVEPGWPLIIAETLFVVALWIAGKMNAPRRVATFVAPLNLLVLFFFVKGNSHHVTWDAAILFIAFCTATGVAAFSGSQFRMPRECAFFCILFLLLPFLLAAGTSNVIFFTASQSAVFSIASVLLLTLTTGITGSETLKPTLCAALCAGFALVIYNGVVKRPYRQDALTAKTMPLLFSATAESVLESPERFMILAELTEKLKFWNERRLPVLASPPALGTIILAGMRPPEVFWLVDEAFIDINRYYLSKWKPDDLPFLLLSADVVNSAAQNAVLRNSGVDIEKDYKVCDSVFIPLNHQYFYFCKPLFE